jgi:hypothetical protein
MDRIRICKSVVPVPAVRIRGSTLKCHRSTTMVKNLKLRHNPKLHHNPEAMVRHNTKATLRPQLPVLRCKAGTLTLICVPELSLISLTLVPLFPMIPPTTDWWISRRISLK